MQPVAERVAVDGVYLPVQLKQPGPQPVRAVPAPPVTRSQWSQIWRPAARTAAIPEREGLHALRHFYASALIRHGESAKTVQRRLGHSSAAVTLDTYTHLWPDSDDRTVTRSRRCSVAFVRTPCGQAGDRGAVHAGQRGLGR